MRVQLGWSNTCRRSWPSHRSERTSFCNKLCKTDAATRKNCWNLLCSAMQQPTSHTHLRPPRTLLLLLLLLLPLCPPPKLIILPLHNCLHLHRCMDIIPRIISHTLPTSSLQCHSMHHNLHIHIHSTRICPLPLPLPITYGLLPGHRIIMTRSLATCRTAAAAMRAIRLGNTRAIRLGNTRAIRLGTTRAIRLGTTRAIRLGKSRCTIRLDVLLCHPRNQTSDRKTNMEEVKGVIHIDRIECNTRENLLQ